MDGLTNAQSKALSYISGSIEKGGSPPTLRELCSYMGYKAIGSAQDVVAALRKKGFLAEPEKQAARAFVLTEKARGALSLQSVLNPLDDILSIPCLGSVPAGNPLEAIEERVDTMQMSTTMLPKPRPNPDNLFAVKTSGLSMVNAGILDGDWLVVNCQEEADPGNIIVARVDGDVTCKRLMKKQSDGWYLQPENPDFPQIFAKDEPFEIVGKVVALQRAVEV